MTQTGVAVLSGLIQGLTEFLPVSSSGHLALFQQYMGMAEPPLAYDVLLHFATMGATIVFFFTAILKACFEWFSGLVRPERRTSCAWTLGWAVIAGNIVTVIVAFMLKKPVEAFFSSTLCVGAALFVTAAILWYGSLIDEGNGRVTLFSGLIVGLVQGIAVIPGISRSGATIIAGQKAGLKPEEAFSFSFLMSLPAIGGATVLQLLEFGGAQGFVDQLPSGWMAGFGLAFISGLSSLWVLRRAVLAKKWRWFSAYCALLAILAITASLNGG